MCGCGEAHVCFFVSYLCNHFPRPHFESYRYVCYGNLATAIRTDCNLWSNARHSVLVHLCSNINFWVHGQHAECLNQVKITESDVKHCAVNRKFLLLTNKNLESYEFPNNSLNWVVWMFYGWFNGYHLFIVQFQNYSKTMETRPSFFC